MAKNPTPKSPYESRWGAGFIPAHSYLAEMMCERQAQKEGTTLFPKFWNDARWKKVFRQQQNEALILLRKHGLPAEAVVRVLRSDEGRKTYSLGAEWLDPLFDREKKRLERELEERLRNVPEEVALVVEKPRENFSRQKSTLGKLRDL